MATLDVSKVPIDDLDAAEAWAREWMAENGDLDWAAGEAIYSRLIDLDIRWQFGEILDRIAAELGMD